jgi:hypothetical protein
MRCFTLAIHYKLNFLRYELVYKAMYVKGSCILCYLVL